MALDKRIVIFSSRLLIAFIAIFSTHYCYIFGLLHTTIVSQISIVFYSSFFNSNEDIFIIGFIALSGLFCFILYELFLLKFSGLGGKHGFLAFCSNCLACFGIFILTKIQPIEYFFPVFNSQYYNEFLAPEIVIGPFITSCSCFIAVGLEPFFKHKNRIASINIVGVMVSLSLNCLKFNKDFFLQISIAISIMLAF